MGRGEPGHVYFRRGHSVQKKVRTLMEGIWGDESVSLLRSRKGVHTTVY
jgi:hypothetical protein